MYVFDGLLILVTLKVAGVGTQSSKKFMHLLIMLGHLVCSGPYFF